MVGDERLRSSLNINNIGFQTKLDNQELIKVKKQEWQCITNI